MWNQIGAPQEHPLEAEIVSLVAQSHKLSQQLLTKLRAFDEAKGWTGFASCAHWLSFRTSLDMGAAQRENARGARAERSCR